MVLFLKWASSNNLDLLKACINTLIVNFLMPQIQFCHIYALQIHAPFPARLNMTSLYQGSQKTNQLVSGAKRVIEYACVIWYIPYNGNAFPLSLSFCSF
jgi:hypothetical protein